MFGRLHPFKRLINKTEEVMKNFLETYAHIINPVVAVAVILGLFYLGSTVIPENEIIYSSTITPKDEITHNEPVVEVEPVVIEQLTTPQPDPEPEPVVEPEPVLEEVVKEVVEVEEDTVVVDTIISIIEVEVSPIEVPVEVEVDSTDKADSTYTREFTESFDVTVSVDGYLIVPDSVDNIVNAFVYAAERVGRNTYFEWRDSTYTTKNFYDNTKKMNRR
jgi:outer membrane biosynthesis protein TonB